MQSPVGLQIAAWHDLFDGTQKEVIAEQVVHDDPLQVLSLVRKSLGRTAGGDVALLRNTLGNVRILFL